MRNSLFSIIKPIALCAVAIAIFGLGQGVVRADEVLISGNTNGCFGAACVLPSTGVAPQSATVVGLTYNNSTFSGTTVGGFLGIGNSPSPPGNVDNLGSLTLTGDAGAYTGQSFTLRVTFTDPQGITGSNSQTFTAELTGTVMGNNL